MKSLGSSVSGFIAKKDQENEPLGTIKGDWKSQIYFNESGGESLLTSAEKCPRLNGYAQAVKNEADLEPTHTYKLWNPVTDSMKKGNLKSARKRKGRLEQWQRDYLKKKEEIHEPTFFKKDSDSWKWNPTSKEFEEILGLPIE